MPGTASPSGPTTAIARVLDGFSAPLDPRAVAAARAQPRGGRASTRYGPPSPPRSPPRRSAPAPARSRPEPASACPGSTAAASRSRCSTPASTAPSPISAAGSSRGSTSSAGRTRPPRSANPQDRAAGRASRHGAGRTCSSASDGPDGIHGVAPGATVLPIRVAGWQPAASGRDAVYARSDQLIAGLDRAVDPNGDGDTHDAVAGRADRGRRAVRGVRRQPGGAGRQRRARPRRAGRRRPPATRALPARSSARSPGRPARPGRSRSGRSTPARRPRPSDVVLSQGLAVLFDGTLPLLDSAAAGTRARPAGRARAARDVASTGSAALVAGGRNPVAAVCRRRQGGRLRRPRLRRASRRPARSATSACRSSGSARRPRASPLSTIARRLPGRPPPLGGAATGAERRARARRVVLLARPLLRRGARAPAHGSRGRDRDLRLLAPTADGEPAFTTVTGTSVSAASVAGAAALLFQARPGLTAADAGEPARRLGPVLGQLADSRRGRDRRRRRERDRRGGRLPDLARLRALDRRRAGMPGAC